MSRPAYRVQLWSSALDGIFMAALLQVSFLLAKDLAAPRWAVMTGAALTAFPMVLTPVLTPFVAKWNRKKLFWSCGVLGRCSFLVLAFVGTWPPFWFVGMLPWFVAPFVLPAFHLYWQANYPSRVRGRLWGRAELLRGLVMVSCYWAFGSALEADPDARRIIFPFAGICGAAALAMIGHVRLRRLPAGKESMRARTRSRNPWAPAIDLLKQRRSFLSYEAGFMLYGMGFMLTNFLRDDHFARDMNLSPLEFNIFLALFQLAMPFASPFYGWLFDRAKAAWTTAVACCLLVPYGLLLAYADTVELVWLSGVAMGIGMAGVHVCWNLGTVEFARGKDPSPYTAIHAAAVGIRAMAALPVAYFIQLWFQGNARPVFLVAGCFFFCAVLWQLRLELSP
ncbi:MAG: MFS transporter [Planctomycetota bacterium]|jgi:MFS family permease